MQTIAQDDGFTDTIRSSRAGSRPRLWAGRVLSGLAVAFLLFDSAGKLLELQPVVDGTMQLGYPRKTVFALGVILLGCVLAYVAPRTSVLGALLLTGYLGGAVAYVAALLWGGLILREPRLRAFLPIRRES